MEKIVEGTDTWVKMSKEEAQNICHMGGGSKCCAFLGCREDGFRCIRMTSLNKYILNRLIEGTMNAKGRGGWKGCPWHGQHPGLSAGEVLMGTFD